MVQRAFPEVQNDSFVDSLDMVRGETPFIFFFLMHHACEMTAGGVWGEKHLGDTDTKCSSFSCQMSLLQDKCLRAGCMWEGLVEMDKGEWGR